MRRFAWIMPVFAIIGGCKSEAPAIDRPPPLRAAAASDLQMAFPVLRARFMLDGGVDVEPVFGASGLLAQQIRQGAPFDLFLAANRKFVNDLATARSLDPDSVRDYATGSLVLVFGTGLKTDLDSLESLKDAAIKKIAIANPEVAPYGAAAREALQKSGLWNVIEPKIVRGESVRQALQFVESGNAEAGIVGKSIADVKNVRMVLIDPGLHAPIVQAMGIVSASKRKADARAFADFVAGPVGRGILADFGLDPPPKAPNKSKMSPGPK